MIKRGNIQIADVRRGAAQIAKVLAGNSLVWEKESAPDGFPISDDFNDGVISALWEQLPNPLNGAEESSGTFHRTGVTGDQQILRLAEPIDFTGRTAEVTLSTIPSYSDSEQYFFLGFPDFSKFVFSYCSGGGHYLAFDNITGNGGQFYSPSSQFGGVRHRILHDAENNKIKCYYKLPEGDWIFTKETPDLTGLWDVTNCKIAIYSGSYLGTANEYTAFDDFIVY